jgi:diguanylate cyclase (GGDEF)-like protein/PAS domain S-box-containing protein
MPSPAHREEGPVLTEVGAGSRGDGGAAPPPTPAPTPGYELLFERNPQPMWIYDVETLRFLAVNAAAVAAYGWSRDEFLAMTIADIRPPEDRLRLVRTVQERDGTGIGSSGVWRHAHRDGTLREVEITSTAVAVSGRRARLVLARDVTDERRLTAALRESEERFRTVFAHAPVAQMTLTPDGGLSQVNAAFCRMAGRPEPDLLGRPLAALLRAGHGLADRLAAIAAGSIEHFKLDTALVGRDGSAVEVELSAAVVRTEEGAARYVVALMQDVTERQAVHRTLAEQAMSDALTGLPNRVLFLDRLDQALHRSRREGGTVGVLFVDLDRFKLVNDTLGHAAGDQVLLAVTSRLRHSVSRNDTIARFGGDEFTVLCENLPDADAAWTIGRRVLDSLAAPLRLDGEERSFTVSIGIAVAGPDDTVTGEFLLQGADSAMYRAKQNGRNRCEIFDQASRARTVERLRQADELRQALEGGELRAYYQPIVRLQDDAAQGVEALVRWQHPRLGLVGPQDFISVAEQTGLIIPMGAWVIERACADVAAMPPAGGTPLALAVNLSARQLARGELLDVVDAALSSTGLDPGRLCLEITESVLMEDLDWSIEALLGLKTLGVRLAIDDFGTGYSSLNYLRRFPVDVVKVDRSFVAGLGVDPAADAIVAAVINLSHALGLSVVAEGVEREEQVVALRALGCDRAQGFYWSPAVPGSRLAQVVAADDEAIEQQTVDVRPVLEERASALRLATGRAVLLRTPSRLPPAVANPGAVRTVLDHLLGNAVAFSGPDRPVIVAATSDRRWVRVSVSDYGRGMTPAEVARCFEPFWQGGDDRRNGTGIGLYIVRSLVEKMGGRVWVRSSPGRGSTFTFAVPRSAATAEPRIVRRPRWERGEQTVIQEFMRQLGVPKRREP